MAFASVHRASHAALSDMNITPLVDVMLVLLIIFMVAAPVLTQRLALELPQHVPDGPPPPKTEPIRLGIDAHGALRWNGRALDAAALTPSLRVEAARDPQPALEIDVAGDASYAAMAGVLAAAKNEGFVRIGFVDGR